LSQEAARRIWRLGQLIEPWQVLGHAIHPRDLLESPLDLGARVVQFNGMTKIASNLGWAV